MTFAGAPTAMALDGISLVTTEFAPITAPSPMLTPGKTFTCAPTQTPLPIDILP